MNYKTITHRASVGSFEVPKLDRSFLKRLRVIAAIFVVALSVYYVVLKLVQKHPFVSSNQSHLEKVDFEIHTVPLPPTVINSEAIIDEIRQRVSVYSFNQAPASFNKMAKPYLISEYSKKEMLYLIQVGVPTHLRVHFKKYAKLTLELSQKAQIDPFWVTSIMWTESHFNPSAISTVRARGLMQIMPGTSQYILRRQGIRMSIRDAVKYSLSPKHNIEMGIFYLKKLLRMFNGNHKLATVAYNMGPYWVLKRLRRRLPVGVKNLYLTKVTRSYASLTAPFLRDVELRKRPYIYSYVARPQIRKGQKFWPLLKFAKNLFLASRSNNTRSSFRNFL